MDAIFGMDSTEEFKSASSEILKNLYSSASEGISNEVLENNIQAAKEEMRRILSDNNFDMESVKVALSSKGWNRDKLKCFFATLDERKTEIFYATLTHYNSHYGETVVNYDWLLKLVLGTSEYKILKYPLLQLILLTINSNNEHNERVYDINKEMLGKIVNVLENVENI